MDLILCPPKIEDVSGSVIFLAGPIRGAYSWQDEAIKIIHAIDNKILIANPRRDYLGEDFVFNAQVDWETHFLRRAGENGAILFWLAKEQEHNCARAYAQTSRFELGEWKTRHECNNDINLAVGIEEGFSNADYVRRRLSQDCPSVPVCSSLEETCRKAVELARR